MPVLVHREKATSNNTLQYFKNVFSVFESSKAKKNFCITDYARTALLNPRLGYIASVLHQACFSSRSIVAVVDKSWVPHIEEEWRQLPATPRRLDEFLRLPPMPRGETFPQRVEKHVLVELMLEPFITEFYIINGVFPFNYKDLLGMGIEGEGDESSIRLWKRCLTSYRKID